MIAIAFLLPIAVGIAFVFLLLFLSAARTGQFDDLDDPAERILHDE